MKEEFESNLECILSDVPLGTLEVKMLNSSGSENDVSLEHFTTKTSGKGRIETYHLYTGIELSIHRYLADQIIFHHDPLDFVLEINHCHRGRVGWNMRGGASVYLGEGDVCVHSKSSCSDSKLTIPFGYYEGISISIDLKRFKNNTTEIAKEAGFEPEKIYQKFCVEKKPFGIPSNIQTDSVFSPLYGLPDSLKMPYYRLKSQEMLLYLLYFEPKNESELIQYGSKQTELIKEIRDFLVQNLDQRFTIEEISKKYLINTSSLKSIFKAVYGMPIAAYMKEYRIHQSLHLLRETDESISTIAKMVGYETQSKFTNAFKKKVQLLPTEYRKLYRKI